MKKWIILAMVTIFIVFAFIGYAIATDHDPHEVTHLIEHHSVGPPTSLGMIQLFSTRVGGADGNKVTKLKIHHHVGQAHRSTAGFRRPFHVWVEGVNGFTGAMQVRGDVTGHWDYTPSRNKVTDYGQNVDCSVGQLVWHCDNNPLSVVKGGGINPSGVRYLYRRVRWQFTGDYTVGGVGVHKTLTPWVSITVRADGTYQFQKGGL